MMTKRPKAKGAVLWDQLLRQTPSSFHVRHIPEPSLAFHKGNLSVDPKTGIELYGPAALDHGARGQIRLGVIGTADTINRLRAWLEKTKTRLDAGLNAKGKPHDPFLAPSFPGFSLDSPFNCELLFTDRLTDTLTKSQIDHALSKGTFEARIAGVIELVSSRLAVLADRNPPPDVVICAMPKAVEAACGRQANDPSRRARLPKLDRYWQKRLAEDQKRGQLSLFNLFEEDDGFTTSTTGFRSFHNALKAHAMRSALTTQLVWESTLEGSRKMQDPATVAWNICTALYYKADNMPWELKFSSPRTCFVGISFYRESDDPNAATRTALAQAFSDTGEGLVLKGDRVTWDRERDRKPHLSRVASERLLKDALALYSQHHDGPPKRVVLHKTSRFWPEELAGFRAGLGAIHSHDFLALERRGIRFLRLGHEPPIRGTMIELGYRNYLLYTQGYVPFLRCYPGPRIPNPLEIVEHHGDSAADVVCTELLALTKLNWNSSSFASGDPVTIKFARGIGSIMKEMPNGVEPLNKYKYYM